MAAASPVQGERPRESWVALADASLARTSSGHGGGREEVVTAYAEDNQTAQSKSRWYSRFAAVQEHLVRISWELLGQAWLEPNPFLYAKLAAMVFDVFRVPYKLQAGYCYFPNTCKEPNQVFPHVWLCSPARPEDIPDEEAWVVTDISLFSKDMDASFKVLKALGYNVNLAEMFVAFTGEQVTQRDVELLQGFGDTTPTDIECILTDDGGATATESDTEDRNEEAEAARTVTPDEEAELLAHRGREERLRWVLRRRARQRRTWARLLERARPCRYYSGLMPGMRLHRNVADADVADAELLAQVRARLDTLDAFVAERRAKNPDLDRLLAEWDDLLHLRARDLTVAARGPVQRDASLAAEELAGKPAPAV